MLMGAELFLQMVAAYRIVHIDGRLGSGKTLFAHELAYSVLTDRRWGYRYLLSNCPSVWRDNPSDVVLRGNEHGELQYIDAVMLLDEGGQFIRSSGEADSYTAYLRKLNLMLLIPSYEAPARKLKTLRVVMAFNLLRLGLPVWIFDYYLVDDRKKDQGKVVLFDPAECYGIYDSISAPGSAGGLDDLLADLQAGVIARWELDEDGRQYKLGERKWFDNAAIDERVRDKSAIRTSVATVASGSQIETVGIERAVDGMAEAAEKLEAWAAISRRSRK